MTVYHSLSCYTLVYTTPDHDIDYTKTCLCNKKQKDQTKPCVQLRRPSDLACALAPRITASHALWECGQWLVVLENNHKWSELRRSLENLAGKQEENKRHNQTRGNNASNYLTNIRLCFRDNDGHSSVPVCLGERVIRRLLPSLAFVTTGTYESFQHQIKDQTFSGSGQQFRGYCPPPRLAAQATLKQQHS